MKNFMRFHKFQFFHFRLVGLFFDKIVFKKIVAATMTDVENEKYLLT